MQGGYGVAPLPERSAPGLRFDRAGPSVSGLAEPVELLVNFNSVPFREGRTEVGPLEVVIATTRLGSGLRVDISLRNPGRQPVSLSHVAVRMDAWPEMVLEHGHQGRSVVRRCRPDDSRPERAELPDVVKGAQTSDPNSAGASVSGDQFLVTTLGVVGFLDARSHLGTITASPRGITATALLDAVPLEPGAARQLDPLWLSDGPPGRLYSELASHWGRQAGARVNGPTLLGWCSRYQYFDEVSPADIRGNLRLAAAHGIEMMQIDRGYQSAIGDWLKPKPGWDEPLGAMAADIRGAGLMAGIWTAPFLAGEDSKLFADYPDWVATHTSGLPLHGAYEKAWNGWAYVLDTTRPDVLDHLRTVYSALRAEGFEYHKIDLCFAAALPGRRNDPALTRAEVLRLGLQAVRDGMGDDAFLLASGCPFGPAVGLVDAMRVSADAAPHWGRDDEWPGFGEAAPAAVNALQASVLRAPLHRRVFINDPDCLILRPTSTDLSAQQVAILVAVVTGVGGVTRLSDDLSLYRREQWDLLEVMRAVLADVDTTLDIEDPFATAPHVRSKAWTSLTVDWHGGRSGPWAQLGAG